MAKKRYTGPYVSRGGEKLRGALEDFSYDVRAKRALDVGASTGGFTDCLLQAGANQVVALDVAYGQFAWKLRQDPRVQVVERSNFKNADLTALETPFTAPFDLVVADLSFIALSKLTEQFKQAITDTGDLILLVKPQFEASRAEVPEGGVITDPELHIEILQRTETTFVQAGLVPVAWTYSPIKGPKGNREFWLHARKGAASPEMSESAANCATIKSRIETAVRQAHMHL
jgi:23S rRNA (cytidine1920-2'-O)/16S rRNA (cytidine1409-2'-O)-methyltransferase